MYATVDVFSRVVPGGHSLGGHHTEVDMYGVTVGSRHTPVIYGSNRWVVCSVKHVRSKIGHRCGVSGRVVVLFVLFDCPRHDGSGRVVRDCCQFTLVGVIRWVQLLWGVSEKNFVGSTVGLNAHTHAD